VDDQERIKIDRSKIKIRKDWGEKDPSTKVERVKTDYKRSDNKKFIEEALEEAEQDDLDIYE
jgi:hypothetical protein